MDNISAVLNIDIYDVSILLRFMQLFSVNSPIGNFSYSHGLELAVKRMWIRSVSEFIVWQQEVISGQLMYLDLPMIHRFYSCIVHNDTGRFLYYLEQLLSFRGTYELRVEEQDRGEVIVQLISNLGLLLNDSWKLMLKRSMLASIVWIGYMWRIPVDMLCVGYAYNYLENNIISGLKLIPFGQFEAQRLIIFFLKFFPRILKQASMITDSELGNSFPLQEIASSCHEVQYARLFRS